MLACPNVVCSFIYNIRACRMWVYSIPSVVGFVLVLLFVTDRPPTPPSASAGLETDHFVVHLSPTCFFPQCMHNSHCCTHPSTTIDTILPQDGLKKVAKNRAYILLVISFGLGAGVVSSFLTLLEQILSDYGYDDVSPPCSFLTSCHFALL